MGKYVGAQAEIDIAEALATGDMNQIETGADDLICMAEQMLRYVGFPERRRRIGNRGHRTARGSIDRFAAVAVSDLAGAVA